MHRTTRLRWTLRLSISLLTVVAVSALFLLPATARSGQQQTDSSKAPAQTATQTAPQQSYGDTIRKTYEFPFKAGNISLPGNAKMENGDFVEPGAFPSAEYCAKCHQEAYTQWRQALHSNSFRTPFYRTSVNILLRTKGIAFARHCDSCHNPVGVLSGALSKSSNVDRTQMDKEGLTCMTCHSVTSVQTTAGNGGIVMGIPSVMVDEKGNRIPGTVPYEEILAHPERHSKAVMRPLLQQPEFCASCHKANLPLPLNDYKWIRAFTAYDEWQNSKFSQRNPLTFYQADFQSCQNCHMKRSPITHTDYGAKNGTLVSHRWLAGNTAVPFYYGFDEQLAKTIEFLKSGNYLNVDIFGLIRNNDPTMIAPLGSVPFKLEPKDVVEALVVIQNKNIGHSLIPEVRDLYEAWVEFTVKDANGNELYHSGFLKPDGMIDPRAHSFTNRPVNTDGEFVDNHKVWTIHSVAYDNTVAAGRSALIRYQFHLPANIQGNVTITARVNYRHLRQSYLNNVLGKDHVLYPVVELASRSRTLHIGDNAPEAPAPGDNADWMRWNNLGIGFLDQLQYSEAVMAFNEVVKLRPDYADGYTNIALTNIEWEKYASARPELERALAIKPDNARALYYLALVERRSGHTAAETADLEKVVTQFPQSRDARRELAVSYYQQHKQQQALEQFQALQGIDADDLTAHYNLSLLYRRMGDKEKAKDQFAMFSVKKVDPGAPTYSLDFLRRHPEISIESVPWHMHTDMDPAQAAAQLPSATPAAAAPTPQGTTN
jgi:tetratricopeptide (TPR) repeat protein/nitrate/TMAO reductase-like tetraheme cytochrome c subunit